MLVKSGVHYAEVKDQVSYHCPFKHTDTYVAIFPSAVCGLIAA